MTDIRDECGSKVVFGVVFEVVVGRKKSAAAKLNSHRPFMRDVPMVAFSIWEKIGLFEQCHVQRWKRSIG
jgi:hypothetical protein